MRVRSAIPCRAWPLGSCRRVVGCGEDVSAGQASISMNSIVVQTVCVVAWCRSSVRCGQRWQCWLSNLGFALTLLCRNHLPCGRKRAERARGSEVRTGVLLRCQDCRARHPVCRKVRIRVVGRCRLPLASLPHCQHLVVSVCGRSDEPSMRAWLIFAKIAAEGTFADVSAPLSRIGKRLSDQLTHPLTILHAQPPTHSLTHSSGANYLIDGVILATAASLSP